MLVKISDSIIQEIKENPRNPQIISLINVIGTKIARGEILFYCKPVEITLLINLDLDPFSKGGLIGYRKRIAELKTMFETLDRYIEILPDEPECRVLEFGGKSTYQISMVEALTKDFLKPVSLVLENSSDYFVYEKIVENYKSNRALSNINIRFDVLQGGGNSCQIEITRHLENAAKIVISVVDSDKKFPDDDFGSTASSCQAVSNELFELLVLEPNELENLLEFELLLDMSVNQRGAKTKLVECLSFVKINSPEKLAYFDYKKPQTCQKWHGNSGYKDYWAEVIQYCSDNHLTNSCSSVECEGCSNPLFPDFKVRISRDSLKTALITEPDYVENSWRLLGKFLFDFGAAMKPIFVS